MRAGSLDRTITIDAYGEGIPDGYGGSTPTWTPFATVRAQLVSMTTEEYLRAYGEGAETALVFRIRYLAGIGTTHRVGYQGRQFNIREVKEIGRRHGLELRCEEVRS